MPLWIAVPVYLVWCSLWLAFVAFYLLALGVAAVARLISARMSR